jgi:D-beta-D-heptose 7-phosphate kinase/D-beta-D-heptose 1-phosphate adenosyltransferase
MSAKALSSRLVSRAQLAKLRDPWRRSHQRVVFTNGVFDILHRGHIELLERAKSFGDVLVVGLNSDASVRRLKGPSRPVNSQRDRAHLLLALRVVDYVTVFGEDTPLDLIRALKPDVIVKGAEYRRSAIVGADLVDCWGGSVRRVTMRKGHSTTNTLSRLSRRKSL